MIANYKRSFNINKYKNDSKLSNKHWNLKAGNSEVNIFYMKLPVPESSLINDKTYMKLNSVMIFQKLSDVTFVLKMATPQTTWKNSLLTNSNLYFMSSNLYVIHIYLTYIEIYINVNIYICKYIYIYI